MNERRGQRPTGVLRPEGAHRGWYLVEYAPPVHGTPFATLSLTTLEHAEPTFVALAMETELDTWLRRYPVPVMVSAFTDSGDLIPLAAVRACDHLIGWVDPTAGTPRLHWRIVPSAQLPRLDLSPPALRQMYSDVPFRTTGDLRSATKNQQRTVRAGTILVLTGLVVVPAAWLLIEFNAPTWLSWLVLLYGLAQVYIQALKLLGLWPKSTSDVAAADEERRMRHHHYHCERNPDGFRRLVGENLDRESRERTHRDAASLKDEAP